MLEAIITVAGLLALGAVFWQIHRLLRERQAADDRRYGGESDTGSGWHGAGE
jgi:hypothetical protein